VANRVIIKILFPGLPGLFAIAAAAFAAGSIVAAGPVAGAEPPYRLNIRNDAFRLVAPGKPRSEPVIPEQLADKPYAAQIQAAALEAALDPALVHALIFVESGYNPAARSTKGAIGLMQVMPATAMRYGVADPGRSPEVNLKVGTRYLKDLMELFAGRVDLALAAYNAGENAVLRHGQRIPPIKETRLYVPAVLSKYREWREPAAAPGPVYIEYLPGTRLDRGSVSGDAVAVTPAYPRP
jgi:soluble lytic murein transglycosylase-like protein